MKKLIFIIILSTVCFAQGQIDDKETLKQINQNVITLYKNRKMDEALKFARQSVELSVRIYGTDHSETATAYTNLGLIYRERKKYKESIESLQTSADIYKKLSGVKSEKLVEIYQTLALSQLLGGMNEDASANYSKAVELAETEFGQESKENFSPILNLANFYAREGKFEKADDLYLKTYVLAIKNFGKKGVEIQQIEDARSCFAGGNFNSEKEKAFIDSKYRLFGEIPERGASINGKAKFLPKPRYPVEAREKRLSGFVPVRVQIDEQGNISEAKSICRDDILGEAAVESAKGAKFSPIQIDGKPTKVSGILIYTFILPR